MTALLWISLEGNPLSYHRKHRTLTIKHLHSSLSESKVNIILILLLCQGIVLIIYSFLSQFVLDHQSLDKGEKMLVALNRVFMVRSAGSPSKDDLASLSGSITSEVAPTAVDNSYLHDFMSSQTSELMDSTERGLSRNRRKKHMREAIITDDEPKEEDADMTSSVVSTSYLETSTDHLETKKQIIALREKFGGEHWLISHAGSFVQDIMGLERSTGPILSSASGVEPFSRVTVASSVDVSSTIISSDTWNESSHEDSTLKTELPSVKMHDQEESGYDTTDIESDNKNNGTTDDVEIFPKAIDTSYDPEEGENIIFRTIFIVDSAVINDFSLTLYAP